MLVTRYQYVNDAGDTVMIKDLSAGVRVLERHDVTEQINNILIQYRAWLDQELVEAMTRAAAPKLILPGES